MRHNLTMHKLVQSDANAQTRDFYATAYSQCGITYSPCLSRCHVVRSNESIPVPT